MSALSNQPTNTNFLSPLGFKMTIKRSPHLNFFVQSATLPGVSIASADVDTPFTKIPYPGTRLTFGNFQVTFKIDEEMNNYLEIFNWLKAIGFPDNFDQYSTIANKGVMSGEGVFSDITLLVLSSAMNPIHEITFRDCFPVDLSALTFDSTSADVEYLTATVTFANRKFDINHL
mgnify:CR=1 FL=1